jgi:hypothetical protein
MTVDAETGPLTLVPVTPDGDPRARPHDHEWHLAEVHFGEGVIAREFLCARCDSAKVE